MSDLLASLQRFADSFVTDVEDIRKAITAAPDGPAARALYGALNYLLDQFDLYPDHIKGMGLVDDAVILRVAAGHAVAAGMAQPAITKLAADGPVVKEALGELAGAIDGFVTRLASRAVRGRTPLELQDGKDARVFFWADLERELKKIQPQSIDVGRLDAIKEFRKMVEAGLKRLGKS